MPDGKYFNRSAKGVTKHTLGYDEEDMNLPMRGKTDMDKKIPMPTERTCDKPVNQDGGLRPWKPMGRK